MWLALLPAIIGLLTKILQILTSEQVQAKYKEYQNARKTNDARKALQKSDSNHLDALMASQHDRVLALCGRSGRGVGTGK